RKAAWWSIHRTGPPARNVVTCVSTTLVDAAHPYVVCMYNIRVAHAQHTHTHVDTRVSTIRRHTRHYVPGVSTYVDTHVSTIVDDVRSVSDVSCRRLLHSSFELSRTRPSVRVIVEALAAPRLGA